MTITVTIFIAWTNGSFDPYLVMKNAVQMEKENAYEGSVSGKSL